jgi:hypothetical protein
MKQAPPEAAESCQRPARLTGGGVNAAGWACAAGGDAAAVSGWLPNRVPALQAARLASASKAAAAFMPRPTLPILPKPVIRRSLEQQSSLKPELGKERKLMHAGVPIPKFA